jgi:translation initiation factor 2B subunit (eIF-2B alpha/beta/delta family)
MRGRPVLPSSPFDAIAADRISGAQGLAIATLAVLEREVGSWSSLPPAELGKKMRSTARALARTQPAMGVFRRWATEWERFAKPAATGRSIGALRVWLRSWCGRLVEEPTRLADVARERLPPRSKVLTLSRSDSVRRALTAPRPERRPGQVVVLESLPGSEGRRFALELRRSGVRARSVPDAVGRRQVRSFDLVLIGADAVYGDGSVVHKVGTLPLARAARNARVPLVVVAGTSKFVPLGRPPRRLPRLFDRTPARLVREYWTDRGARTAAELRDVVRRQR